jgi:predicted NBD/HSP70 family sugar kinase
MTVTAASARPGVSPNEDLLMGLLECWGPVTRAELAALAGLPRTTVTGIVSDLLSRRLVAEHRADTGERGAGRPAATLSLAGPPRLVGVVSCGEGIITASLLSYAGQVLARRSCPVAPATWLDLRALSGPAGRLLEATLGQVQAGRLAAVVLGVPGARSPADSADVLPGRPGVPVLVENDANLGALGEAAFGAGRGLDSLIFVKLSHNVGAGMIFSGFLLRGASGFAGELAHVQVREEGTVCRCGGRGCLATLVGPSLEEFVRRAYEERLGVAEVLALAAEHEPGVRRLFADLGRIIGRPLADLCTMIDPAAIVVDGSLGAAGEFVLAGIRESIDRHAAPAIAGSIQVRHGTLGEDAEPLGGVALARYHRVGCRVPPAGSSRLPGEGAA